MPHCPCLQLDGGSVIPLPIPKQQTSPFPQFAADKHVIDAPLHTPLVQLRLMTNPPASNENEDVSQHASGSVHVDLPHAIVLALLASAPASPTVTTSAAPESLGDASPLPSLAVMPSGSVLESGDAIVAESSPPHAKTPSNT